MTPIFLKGPLFLLPFGGGDEEEGVFYENVSAYCV